jgi:hypothetical protein
MPIEGRPPKAAANMGTTRMPTPGTPVLETPTRKAAASPNSH